MKIKQLIAAAATGSAIAVCGQVMAVPVDTNLTVAGSSATLGAPGATAKFTQSSFNPAGTGVIGSFVRIDGGEQEQAYNTSTPNVYDNKSDATHNHPIQVGQIGFTATAGGDVMRFLLDINEPNSSKKSLLNLDEVQIFLSRNPLESATPAMPQGQLLVLSSPLYLVYQLDAGLVDRRVILDGDTGGGSGHGDMLLDISRDLFNAAFTAGGFNTTAEKNNAYIYLYSRFGSNDNINDANFEEWAALRGNAIIDGCTVNCGQQEVPEPGSLSLIALGLLGAGSLFARRRRG